MLTITQNAAEALDSILASIADAPETAGLRIAPGTGENGQPGLTLQLAAEPAPGDQIVAGQGVPVFVDAGVAEELDDKVLDAQVEGGQIGFTLARA